jgi:SNF2 family DNA or RNA helicase
VLVFVQFGDLMKKVAQALSAHKIQFLEIQGTAHTKSSNLQRFQDGGPERVLLLNVMDESASGANLTGANHAVFLSPLLAPSQEIYDACETQAIGRLRRFGQRKHVYVYRFLTENTIDVEIFEERTGRKDVLKEVEMEVEEVA